MAFTGIDDIMSSIKDNLVLKDKNIELKTKTDTELIILFDSDISDYERKNIIKEIYDRDKNLIIECANNVINTYMQYKNSFKKQILFWLIGCKEFNFPIRIRCIDSLQESNQNVNYDELYLKLLEEVKDETIEFKRKFEVGTTYFWNVFKNIIKKDISLTNSLIIRLNLIWKSVVNDTNIQEEFRYKLLQNLCNDSSLFEDTKPVNPELRYLFSESALQVYWEDYRYYIYIIQFIIKTNKLSSIHLDILIKIIEERNLNNNGIADISDFLIGIKENNNAYNLPEDIDKYKKIGQELLDKISFDGKGAKSIYNNAQNIHKVNVEESINPFIEKLVNLNIDIPTNEDEYEDFVERLTDRIRDYSENILNFESSDQIRIINSINRFILDNTLYSKYNVSLLNLLIRSEYYIQTHPQKEELMLRLCQELCDMADTCTTGHIYRLVNVFSGYEVAMSIPIEEEIKSCVFARLKGIIYKKSEEEQEKIFNCIGTSEEIKSREKVKIDTASSLIGSQFSYIDNEEKEGLIQGIIEEKDINIELFLQKSEDPEMEFNRLMGKDLLVLLEELRGEYANIISEQELDTYFRKSINLFQVGEGI
jgi:hypothetical protein